MCGCKQDWTSSNFIERSIESIKNLVRNDSVVLGLSGGIDSSVVAALIHLAIGDRLTCLFVDNGLLRKNEASAVLQIFKDRGLKIRVINARAIFFE